MNVTVMDERSALVKTSRDLREGGFITEAEAEALTKQVALLLREHVDDDVTYCVVTAMDTLVWFLMQSRQRNVFDD